MSYRYQGEPEQRIVGALPEGDYAFVISDCGEPYEKNDKWILAVKLTIQPQGIPVFCNPWSGIDKNGENRDGIAELLHAVGRVPKVGAEPNWKSLVGAKGKCRLKMEIAQKGSLAGKEVNKVHYFYRPKEVGPTAGKTYSQSEFAKARQKQAETSGGAEPEPDSIPY
jgi:hypothetical protein